MLEDRVSRLEVQLRKLLAFPEIAEMTRAAREREEEAKVTGSLPVKPKQPPQDWPLRDEEKD